MPLRLRVLPSTYQTAGSGQGPPAERVVELPDGLDEIRIGRRQDVELPLPFSVLSGVHARLVRQPGSGKEGWLLEDLGSRNGTFLAGVRLGPGDRRPLTPGAHFTLAHIDLVFEGRAAQAMGAEGTATIARRLVNDLFAGGAERATATVTVVSGAPVRASLRLEEPDRPYVVGRVETCDLPLPVEEISREHTSFVRRWDGVYVADLGSKNGVRVNGVLTTNSRLHDNDLVQIGPVSLRLFDPEDRYLQELASNPDAIPIPVPAMPPAVAPASPSTPRPPSSATTARNPSPLSDSTPDFENDRPLRARAGSRVVTTVAVLVLAALAALAGYIVFAAH